jgi:chromosome segregation ATPase
MGATKEQERKALEQIRKIVEGLGADSYIGMAFEGCFEIARDNIENDWGCSMKQRALEAEEKAVHLEDIVDAYERGEEKTQEEIAGLREQLEVVRNQQKESDNQITQMWNKYREQEDRAEAAEQTIIQLKAKLYDLMTA